MRSMLSHALLAALVVIPIRSAWAQDADGDGTADSADAFPCDPGAAAMAFAPGLGVHGLMLVEDQWPSLGDDDFDDAVLHYNYMFRLDAAGQVVGLRLTLNAQALGGTFDNGVALRLPVPASSVASATRIVGSGAPQPLSLSSLDAEAVIVLSNNLRELFAGQTGQINSLGTAPTVTGQTLELDIVFTAAVNLAIGAAPYDLFIFRTQRPAHEIHRPEYSGTAAMDANLFNTQSDASSPSRHFVDGSGLPFVLLVPEGSAYPLEGVSISSLFPGIIGFASSGGASNADFYLSPQLSFAYANPPAPTLPRGDFFSADTSCVMACTPGAPGCGVTSCAGATSGGVQVIDPNGGSSADAFSAYCEAGGEGWTKLSSAQWPFFFSGSTWQDYNGNAPDAANYSAVQRLADFQDDQGCFTFKLAVGNSGSWDSSTPAHTTVWRQCHNPFTESSNGSDYTYISGQESSTCGGFNGLHHRYQGFSYSSDADSNDSVNCWWMQVLPHTNYNNSGYLEGYGGVSNYHNWQVLWVKTDARPVIDSLSASTTTPDPDVQVSLSARAHDPSGQPVSANWTVSDTRWQLNTSGLAATVVAPNVAVPPLTVTLTVSNASGGVSSQTLVIHPTLACAGGTAACPAQHCSDITGPEGLYWLDSNGGSPVDAYQAHCRPGGNGWVKVMSAAWPFFYNSSNWPDLNAGSPTSADFSMLHRRQDFADAQGCYTMRLEVGNAGSWNNSTPAHFTEWTQCHDAFTQTSNGSDYSFISGEESTTCGGFNGLHHKYQGNSYTSDPDSNDGVGCWWMQVVPNRNYNSRGYLEGYGGTGNYHNWQSLWMRSAP